MTFRVNYIKSNNDDIENSLKENNILFKKEEISVNDIKDYFYIVSDDKAKDLDIYKKGKIYMQNASSMYPALHLCNEIKKGDILDMCAAPGGKSLHLQSISKNAYNITAIEKDKKRFERMKYNFELQGANVFSKQISAIDLDDMLKFDAIILDAPCSGSGTDKGLDDKNNIDRLVRTQRKLIDKAKKLLKKDGLLVYSTCSIYKEEDEEEKDYILLDRDYDLIKENKIDKNDIFEGFYIAIFKKR